MRVLAPQGIYLHDLNSLAILPHKGSSFMLQQQLFISIFVELAGKEEKSPIVYV